MDIRHYFESVDFSKFYHSGLYQWKYSVGYHIEKTTLAISPEKIEKLDIAIIGVPFDSRNEDYTTKAPDKIREEFYRLSGFSNSIKIADFGNLKPASSLKGNYQAVRDIVDYFCELKIVTLIIGGSQDLNVGVCEAFANSSSFSYSTVDALLDIKKGKEALKSNNYLSRIFTRQPRLFQFSLIAFQSHLFSTELFSKTKGINHHIPLGLLRENISRTEPMLRNSDVLSFDIGAVKLSDSPGCDIALPNGLRSEEACQLAKYAGFSNRLKVFGLFEMNTKNDRQHQTANLSAQIIWYFIDGYSNRIPDDTAIGSNFTIYQVEVKNVDFPVVFLKSKISDRWWFEVPVQDNEPMYLACSENEYKQASNNEIPELWLKYIQKSDEILK